MILYLFKKYVIFSLLICIVLIAIHSMAGAQNAVLTSFIWSGFISGYVTYLFIHKRNMWVLYDNLRLPRYGLLGISILLFEVVTIAVILFIRGKLL